MVWLCLVIGVLVGFAGWGFEGAIVLGFLGLVVGWILKFSLRRDPPPAAAPVDAGIIAALDRRVAALEARVKYMERHSLAQGGGLEEVVREESQAAPAVELPPEPEMAAPPAAESEIPDIAAVPAEPPPPRRPNVIVQWFTGGNTIVRVGLVILFVGLGFLIKYGVEHQMVPIELRVASVAAAGLALLVVGWRLRARRAGYALSLQGAGVAILYLTIFGAMRLYGLVPAGLAFALLLAIAVLSAFLAIVQDSLVLAAFGAAGGFLAPVLASSGGGSHVMLFSYYLMLNAGIVAIAWFKAWRVLNLLGFLFTFAIGLAWGVRSYQPEHFGTTEPFLVAFFLIYVAIPILFARKQAGKGGNYVDGTLVFGVPIAAFGLQAALMRGTELGLAFSSVALAALYLALATWLRRAGRERWALLAEAYLALGVVFATLAIPLALDARWTSAAWALEGAAIVWIGVRQGRALARIFGALLQLAAGAAFFNAYPRLPEGPPFADAVFIGALLISIAGFLSNRVITRAGDAVDASEKSAASLYFAWGLGWWIFAAGHEIQAFVVPPYRVNAMLAFAAATTIGFSLLAVRWSWREARWLAWGFAPVMWLLAFWGLASQSHPLANLGWLAWPFAFVVHLVVLRREEGAIHASWLQALHAMGAVLAALLGAIELEWLASEYTARGTAWSLAARIVSPAALVLLLSSRWADGRWPVAAHPAAYRLGAVLPMIVAMGLLSLLMNVSHGGRSDPLPYLPLLNAIDLAHVLAAIAVASAWLAWRRGALEPPRGFRGRAGVSIAGAVVFIWLTAILLRTLHHWAHVPYDGYSLSRSFEVQASLSVFWSFLALAAMVLATRTGRRALWMVGAALMGVVVVKLVLVDLSNLGGIERIVSFIGVGVLMLVIGFFSPVPPRKAEAPS